MTAPLIWTTRGNVPESELTYSQEWQDQIVCEGVLKTSDGSLTLDINKTGTMTFIERYHFKDTGELAKESCHVCLFKGPELGAEQGVIG